jgi:hypothetical protein
MTSHDGTLRSPICLATMRGVRLECTFYRIDDTANSSLFFARQQLP